MNAQITQSLPPSSLRIGVIEARGVVVKPSSEEYLHKIADEISFLLSSDFIYPDHMQKGIRGLLKGFGFHPSGRNRPASEFLFKDLQNRGQFNSINNVVDINNHLSLIHHLPISVLDIDTASDHLCIRLGLPEEEYVFNPEGQILSLKNLLLIARHGADNSPIGSPVKDSQETKIFEKTKNIIAFIYTSANLTSTGDLNKIMNNFTALLKTEAEANEIKTLVIEGLP